MQRDTKPWQYPNKFLEKKLYTLLKKRHLLLSYYYPYEKTVERKGNSVEEQGYYEQMI